MRNLLIFILLILGEISLSRAAKISGKIKIDASCDMKTPAMVWISKGRTLLYQAEVPSKGSFEFHTPTGSFHIFASTRKGCTVEKQVTLARDEENQNFSLNLERPRIL